MFFYLYFDNYHVLYYTKIIDTKQINILLLKVLFIIYYYYYYYCELLCTKFKSSTMHLYWTYFINQSDKIWWFVNLKRLNLIKYTGLTIECVHYMFLNVYFFKITVFFFLYGIALGGENRFSITVSVKITV